MVVGKLVKEVMAVADTVVLGEHSQVAIWCRIRSVEKRDCRTAAQSVWVVEAEVDWRSRTRTPSAVGFRNLTGTGC